MKSPKTSLVANMRIDSRIEHHVGHLIGLECWTVIGDESPDVHIGLGGKTRRERPLTNPTLSNEERLWRPECDLLIRCSWRLQSNSGVLAADCDGGGALKVLVGHTLDRLEIRPPWWDLILDFASDLQLVVFANETRAGYDNFSIGVGFEYWAVHANGLTGWA